jgi:hypothetical protein
VEWLHLGDDVMSFGVRGGKSARHAWEAAWRP